MSRYLTVEHIINLEDFQDEIFEYFESQGIKSDLKIKLIEYLEEMKNKVYYENASDDYKKAYEDLDKIFFYERE